MSIENVKTGALQSTSKLNQAPDTSATAKQSQIGKKPQSVDSVTKSLTPEIESVGAAEALGRSLIERLPTDEKAAFDAIGNLDESRIEDLLKD